MATLNRKRSELFKSFMAETLLTIWMMLPASSRRQLMERRHPIEILL